RLIQGKNCRPRTGPAVSETKPNLAAYNTPQTKSTAPVLLFRLKSIPGVVLYLTHKNQKKTGEGNANQINPRRRVYIVRY
ncbi:hypothetical protein OFM21_33725, partial [Escherichia coli]|nr:hypothetical protein [Escherichia coli]